MKDRDKLDLQREADEEHPWTLKSEDQAERLERFKQGELDRQGRPVDEFTEMGDFYTEKP